MVGGVNALLDPVLGWVLNMPLWLGIFILAFIITLIINLVYRFATDQTEMKRLKETIKKYQKQMKKHKDEPKKVMEIQNKAMSVNLEYMKKSMRPTLFTFIPLIFIFGWMNANLALEPLSVGEQVELLLELDEPALVSLEAPVPVAVAGERTRETVESQVSWLISASDPGEYILEFSLESGESASRSLFVGQKADSRDASHDAPFDKSTISYEKSKPFPNFSLFGYVPGWLMTYIFFSIVLSVLMRKLMGLY